MIFTSGSLALALISCDNLVRIKRSPSPASLSLRLVGMQSSGTVSRRSSFVMGRDWRLLAVLFLMSWTVGVLPLQWNTHINYHLHLCGQDRDCFSTSTKGRLVTAVHMFAILYCSGGFSPSLQLVSSISSLISTLGFTSTLSALFLIMFYQPKTLAICCSSACKISTLSPRHKKQIPFLLFLTLSIYPFVTEIYFFLFTFVLGMPFEQFIEIVKTNFHHTPAVCIEVIFVVLCFIVARAFEDINNQMRKIRSLNYNTFGLLVGLLKDFTLVSRCAISVAEYFSPHFVIIFIVYMVRMIFYAIILLRLPNNNLVIVNYGVYIFYHTGRMFFICKWSEKVKNQSLETLRIFRQIRILWVGSLSQDQDILLDGYEEWIGGCDIEFTACGLFSINTQQILNVLGTIVTYSMVALQAK